jgi:hypothetical protein
MKKKWAFLEEALLRAVAEAAEDGRGYGGKTRTLKEAEIWVLRNVRVFLLGRGNILRDDYDEGDYVRRVQEYLGAVVIRDSPEKEAEQEGLL